MCVCGGGVNPVFIQFLFRFFVSHSSSHLFPLFLLVCFLAHCIGITASEKISINDIYYYNLEVSVLL